MSKPNFLIFHAVRGELSWTHYRQLIYIDNPEKRSFFEHQTILHSWSSRELKKQIKAQLYENTPKKEIQSVFQTQLPAIRPQEVFKETYDFKFIELRSDTNEKELEDKIICREAGREEVIYALDGLEEKIFIAKYKVKLPSEAKIKKAFRDL